MTAVLAVFAAVALFVVCCRRGACICICIPCCCCEEEGETGEVKSNGAAFAGDDSEAALAAALRSAASLPSLSLAALA